MKKIFKPFMALMSLALLMASCDKSPVKSDYDITFDESQKGFTFALAEQGNSYGIGYEETTYTIQIFRNYTQGEEVLNLVYAGSDAENFKLPESVTFENGKNVANLDIDITGMPAGAAYEFAIAFDGPVMQYRALDSAALTVLYKKDSAEYAANNKTKQAAAMGEKIAALTAADTVYVTGIDQVVVSFSVEYTWISKGVVEFYSSWEGASAKVEIEQALEYTDAEGYHYMRLNSPYYHVAPKYCTSAGKHAYFYLDKDYNANSSCIIPGFQWIEDDVAWYYSSSYASYAAFINQENVYVYQTLWSDGSSLWNPTQEQFLWTKEHRDAAIADATWEYTD